MTVRIPQIPRRVCGELPLWDHPGLVLSGLKAHNDLSEMQHQCLLSEMQAFTESSPKCNINVSSEKDI